MPFPNFHAARVRQPGLFERIRVLRKTDSGVMILGGPLKNNPTGSSVIQTYRFPKERFTVARARTWLSNNADKKVILFEKVTG